MGETDVASREYLAQPEHFADVCNYLLYGGKQVVKPDELRELDPTAMARLGDRRGRSSRREGHRDLLRLWEARCDDQAIYVMLGIEEQSGLNRAMPARCMLYDALSYAGQIERIARENRAAGLVRGVDYLAGLREEDRLTPVITLVVYLSPNEWAGPESLHGLLGDCDPRLLEFVQDYHMSIIAPARMEGGDFDKFATELGLVLEYIKCSGDDVALDRLVHEREGFRGMSAEGAELVNLATDSRLELPEGKEKVDMCKAIEDMRRKSEEKGMEKGMEKGKIADLKALMQTMSLTAAEALEALLIPEGERARYLELLEA